MIYTKPNAPRIYCIDNDGYLGSHGMPWDPEAISALSVISENAPEGISLITGRPLPYAKKRCREAEISPVAIGGEMGGYIEMDDGEVITFSKHQDDMKRLQDYISSLMRGDSIILPGEDPIPAVIEPGKRIITTISMDPEYNSRVKGLTSKQYKRSLDKIEAHVRSTIREMGYKVSVVRNSDSVEALPEGLDKAFAMDEILGRMKINHENAFAGGDGSSDIPMIIKAGFCGTTANANEKVKKAVIENGGHVSGKNYGSGFKDIIENLYGTL